MERTFFVVEDHALTNLGIRQFIAQHAGDRFVCRGHASSRPEALERLAACEAEGNLPACLILDLFLGPDNGLELLKECRARWPAMQVLVYSMYNNPGIVTLALESGAQGFVSKSAPEEELLRAREELSQGKPYVQQTLVAPLFVFRSVFESLTRQEQNIFKKIIARHDNARIASELSLSPRSVENYLSRIYSKTGCRSHEELIARFG